MRFLRENSLSLFFGVLFLAALGGQSAAGQRAFNAELRQRGSPESKPVGAPHDETGASG